MPRKTLPFQLDIAEPCHEQWSAMTGSASQRFCDSCQKHVHNLAAMTPTEIEREVIITGGRLCGRIIRDCDGRVLTLDEPRPRVLPLAAGFLLASALTANAHGQGDQRPGASAKVKGSVNAPAADQASALAIVTFSQDGSQIARVHTDESGGWQVELQPGTYDLRIALEHGDSSVGLRGVEIEAGEQDFGPLDLRPTDVQATLIEATPTIGAMVATVSTRYRWHHPVRYLNYLRHRYLARKQPSES